MTQEKSKNKGLGFSRAELESPKGIDYLFLIAIDNYKFLPKLGSPIKDVTDIKRILIEKYSFSEKNCICLFNEEASKKNIYYKFRELIKTLNIDDNIVIYFSGHGEFEKDTSMGYWIPYDGDPKDLSTYIENTTITSFIKAMQAKHVIVFADSSFSNSLFIDSRMR